MIDLSTVKWLQVEATSKCNAWCPGCSRNNNGHGLANGLVIEDLSSTRFSEVLQLFPNLETVDFCGTFGDAIAASNIIELTNLAKIAKQIMVRTNGSLRTKEWWAAYAKQLEDRKHNVWFCLDGLEDTHHLYRQGTDFNTIIRNATSFIRAGGYATWQFIPWEHNEHQIKECLKLSQELGFKEFKLVKSVRSNFDALHYRTGEPYTVRPWSRDKKVNPLTFKKTNVNTSDCMHLSLPSMYLNADGTLNTCCYFNKFHSSKSVSDLLDIPALLSDKSLVPNVCKLRCGSAE